MSARLFAPRGHHLLLLFTVLGEGRARLVYANRSLFPFPTVKLNGFGSFSLKIKLWPLWEPPGWPLDKKKSVLGALDLFAPFLTFFVTSKTSVLAKVIFLEEN